MSKINSIIIIDFETGGLSPKKNPIIEVAYQVIQLDDYKPILEFESFIQPYNELVVEDQALKANGITYNQFMNGVDSKTIVKKMEQDFALANTAKNFRKKPILVGHNIGFDIGFLSYLFSFHKVDISKYLDCNEDDLGRKIPKSIDTQSLAKQRWGHEEAMEKYNLGACCDKAGIELIDAHRAMNDVKATKELFLFLTNNLRSGTGQTTEEQTEHTRFRNKFQF